MTLQEFLGVVKRSEHEIVVLETPLAAVTRNGCALQYVKEQTPDVVLAAVTADGDALQYVKEQTPDVVLAAVTRNGYALQYVNKNCFDKEA